MYNKNVLFFEMETRWKWNWEFPAIDKGERDTDYIPRA